METNLFNLWTYFIIYSICGWILESVYRSFREKKIINTGFLNGPMCPIYGIGAIIMILFLGKFSKNIIVLFLVSFIVLSIWEYIVGVYLEKTFKTKYWDYSDHKINIKGRVCLSNSICWGILGVLFIKYIHPFIKHEISSINLNVLKVIVLIITLIFVIDTIMSIVKTKNIKETLEELKKIKTNDIISKNQLSIEKLKKKKNRLLRSLYWRVYRLKKAFPTLDTKEIREILEKKIEVIKKSQKK